MPEARRPLPLAFPWSRALVIGLGASGLGVARLLLAAGVAVRGYDQRAGIVSLPAGLEPLLGTPQPSDTAFDGVDLIVLSPGVPPAAILARAARLAPDATVHGEMSLALWTVRATWPDTPTVLITGTNGKSTVTALIGSILGAAGLRPFVGGNLGPTISQLVADVAGGIPLPGALVLECSSYQLETLDAHPTSVAILLNVAPDHLTRYAHMDEYADTKARVFSGLVDGGLALLDARDAQTQRLRPTGPFEVLLVDGTDRPHVDDERLWLSEHESIDRGVLRIAGRHNAKNALFAALSARHLGVSLAVCTRGIAEFSGLPHRMQLVRELGGVAFYDDSKATNVSAVLASLEGFARPFVLIVGGQAKGEDLGPLLHVLRAGAKAVVALGESREQFIALGQGVVPTFRVDDMARAVQVGRSLAVPGDAVVLSPACASFDMYDGFAHRGRVFAEAVLGLREQR